MALRAQRISIDLVKVNTASSYSLKPFIEPDGKVYQELKAKEEDCTVIRKHSCTIQRWSPP